MKSTLRNRMMLIVGLVTGISVSLMYSAGADEPAKVESKEADNPAPRNIAQPFPPSMLAVANNRKLKVEDFEEARNCATCHPRQTKGWLGSMHSIAFKDPVFQAEWALAEKAMGGQLMNHCGGCHSPIGVTTGTIKFDPSLGKHGGFTAPKVAEEGVTCDVCHSTVRSNHAQSASGDPGNASLVLDPGETKYGPLKNAKSGYHETQYSDLHTKAEFCGNCHNIFHPFNQFPIEHTYDEWKTSPYAQADIPCQDCHMVPVETAVRVADEMKRARDLDQHGLGGKSSTKARETRDLVHDHGFVGGNAVIAPALGVANAEEHKIEAIKRLQNVAELDMDIKSGKGGAHELRVKVINARAGHHLPTSLTFIRLIWLDVTVTDDQGRVLLRSGELGADNRFDEDAVVFGNKSVDKDGKPTVNPWEIARFEEMNTIPPKGYRYGKYAFKLPSDTKAFKVDAKLNYMSYDQAVADKLLGKGAVKVPVVEMKSINRVYGAADLKAIEAPVKVSSN